MADGIRIQPQPARLAEYGISDLAGRLFVVRDVSRPIVPSDACSHCGYPHDCKSYHLQLDQDGTVIVSITVWRRMLGLYDHGGFEEVNVVAEPPAQGLNLAPVIRPLNFDTLKEKSLVNGHH